MNKQSQHYSTSGGSPTTSQINNKYYNTFYQSSNNQQNRQNMQQTHNIITSSKKLIQQIEDKKYKNFIKSKKKINNQQTNKNVGSGSRQNISIKDKIQGSLRNINQNGTIADQFLFKTTNTKQDYNSKQEQKDNQANKNDKYLNVIQNIFSHKSKKKRRARKNNHSSSSEQNKNKNKKSHKELQILLNQQINRNVKIKGSHNYINAEQNQDQPQNRNKTQIKKFSQELSEQLQHFDANLQENRSKLMIRDDRKSHNSSLKQSKFAQNKTKIRNQTDSQRDRISIQLKSKQQIQNHQNLLTNNHFNKQQNRQLINLQLSSSSDSDQQKINQNINKQDNQFFKILARQIQKDIDNMKIRQSKTKINSLNKLNSNSNQQNSFQENNGQKQYSNPTSKNNLRQKQNNQQIKNKQSNIPKKGKDLFSFRQQQNEESNIFDIPRQILSMNDEINEQKIPYHYDYGLNISQSKIQSILETISKRVKYSPAVIDIVMYEHDRQDNNQLQIDSRFQKQQKQRYQLIKKIDNYVINKYNIRQKKYKITKNQKFYQFGKKMMLSNQIWRSPGKSITNKTNYISLNTPILNGESCCQKQKLKFSHINPNTNWRKLLQCRSADNLASLNQIFINSNKWKIRNKVQKKENNLESDSSDQGYLLDQQSKNQNNYQKEKCIMKENSWQTVKQFRRQIDLNY